MPLEQVGNALAFYGFYTSGKIGRTGLAPTVDVYRIGTNGASVQVVTAGASTEIGTSGLYRYGLSSGLNTVEGEYLAMFRTSDTTVDARDIAAVWAVGKAGLEDLDAAISTRATPADVGNAVTTAVGGRSPVRIAVATSTPFVPVALSLKAWALTPRCEAAARRKPSRRSVAHVWAGASRPLKYECAPPRNP